MDGFLYSDYSTVQFSEECVSQYRQKRGRDPDIYFDRRDPILLQFFHDKGSKWMSGTGEIKFHPNNVPTGILYNASYGGFGLSKECIQKYKDKTGKTPDVWPDHKDPVLIQLFHEKGKKWISEHKYSNLKFYAVPADLFPFVNICDEYDGIETPGVCIDQELKRYNTLFFDSVREDESNLHEEYHKYKRRVNDLKKKYKSHCHSDK